MDDPSKGTDLSSLVAYRAYVKELYEVDIGDFKRKLLSEIYRLKRQLGPLKSTNENLSSLYQDLKIMLLSHSGEDIELLRFEVLEKIKPFLRKERL